MKKFQEVIELLFASIKHWRIIFSKIPKDFLELKIRFNVIILLSLNNRFRMYQSIPFADFFDIRPSRERAEEKRWKEIRKKLPGDLKKVKILDLGSAEGYFGLQCAKLGANVVAVEHYPRKVKLMKLLKEKYRLENIQPIEAKLEDFSIEKLGKIDYVFYLNIHQHIYKKSPEAASRILTEISRICSKGIFFETRPVEFSKQVENFNLENPQPFRRVEDVLEIVKKGTGFSKAEELFYEGFDDEPNNLQSVPGGAKNHYRLFFLKK